jgi:hypothetical protein
MYAEDLPLWVREMCMEVSKNKVQDTLNKLEMWTNS